jgi:hypothetical protein
MLTRDADDPDATDEHVIERDRCDAAARFADLLPAYQELAARISE